MRYYVVSGNRFGPAIIAETLDPNVAEDSYGIAMSREEVMADPKLRIPLENWESGDDRAYHVRSACWALLELHRALGPNGLAEFTLVTPRVGSGRRGLLGHRGSGQRAAGSDPGRAGARRRGGPRGGV